MCSFQVIWQILFLLLTGAGLDLVKSQSGKCDRLVNTKHSPRQLPRAMLFKS